MCNVNGDQHIVGVASFARDMTIEDEAKYQAAIAMAQLWSNHPNGEDAQPAVQPEPRFNGDLDHTTHLCRLQHCRYSGSTTSVTKVEGFCEEFGEIKSWMSCESLQTAEVSNSKLDFNFNVVELSKCETGEGILNEANPLTEADQTLPATGFRTDRVGGLEGNKTRTSRRSEKDQTKVSSEKLTKKVSHYREKTLDPGSVFVKTSLGSPRIITSREPSSTNPVDEPSARKPNPEAEKATFTKNESPIKAKRKSKIDGITIFPSEIPPLPSSDDNHLPPNKAIVYHESCTPYLIKESLSSVRLAIHALRPYNVVVPTICLDDPFSKERHLFPAGKNFLTVRPATEIPALCLDPASEAVKLNESIRILQPQIVTLLPNSVPFPAIRVPFVGSKLPCVVKPSKTDVPCLPIECHHVAKCSQILPLECYSNIDDSSRTSAENTDDRTIKLEHIDKFDQNKGDSISTNSSNVNRSVKGRDSKHDIKPDKLSISNFEFTTSPPEHKFPLRVDNLKADSPINSEKVSTLIRKRDTSDELKELSEPKPDEQAMSCNDQHCPEVTQEVESAFLAIGHGSIDHITATRGTFYRTSLTATGEAKSPMEHRGSSMPKINTSETIKSSCKSTLDTRLCALGDGYTLAQGTDMSNCRCSNGQLIHRAATIAKNRYDGEAVCSSINHDPRRSDDHRSRHQLPLVDSRLPPKKRKYVDENEDIGGMKGISPRSQVEEHLLKDSRPQSTIDEQYRPSSYLQTEENESPCRIQSNCDKTELGTNECEKVVECQETQSSSSSSSPNHSNSSRENFELQSAIVPDEDGDLPLHVAVVQGLDGVIDSLLCLMLQLRTGVDIFNRNRQTPLHLAVITQQSNVLGKLLFAGASPNLSDRKGNNSIHLAVKGHCLDCLRVLLTQSRVSVDVDAMNYEGLTSLHLAVQQGDVAAIDALVSFGAQINRVDGKNGRSALYYAAELGNLTTAERLLSLGASVSIPSYSGCLPVNAARANGPMVQLLERHSAGSFPAEIIFKVESGTEVLMSVSGSGLRSHAGKTRKTRQTRRKIEPSTHGT